MKTEIRPPKEILALLKPYLDTQRVTVVVEKNDGGKLAGALTSIKEHNIEVQNVGPAKVIPISEIREITHGRLIEPQALSKRK